jgi:hypothetical protein
MNVWISDFGMMLSAVPDPPDAALPCAVTETLALPELTERPVVADPVLPAELELPAERLILAVATPPTTQKPAPLLP